MVTFAVCLLAIVLMIFILVKRKCSYLLLEPNEISLTAIFVLNESACNFIDSMLRRKRRRTKNRLGAVF